jgi:DNA-binding transcriptional LysR family regulator
MSRQEATLEELRVQPLVVREPGSGSREALERALETAGTSLADMDVIAEMGSTGAIKQAVKAGVGVSIISRRAVEDESRLGLLGCVTIRELKLARQFYVVTHAARSRSPLARAFVDFLKAAE